MRRPLLSISVAVAIGLTAASGCAPTTQKASVSSQPQSSINQPSELATMSRSGVVHGNMDLSVDPGDDFFSYVNGTWYANYELPADKPRFGAFIKLADESQENVLKIIEETAQGNFETGSDEQKIGDLYQSFMDLDTRNTLDLAPMQEVLDQINTIESYSGLATYLAHSNKYGNGGLFALAQYADFKNPDYYMMYVWQGGIGLPEREYYFKQDDVSERTRNAYVSHIATILTLSGEPNATVKAEKIMALETKIAALHMKKEQTRNWAVNYNKVPLNQLPELMPDFDWDAFISTAQIDGIDGLVVMQTDYFKGLNDIFKDTPLDMWKLYLRWHAVNGSAAYLSERFADANFAFYDKVLRGVEEPKPLWRRGVDVVNGNVGELVGKVYVKRHFPEEAKVRMEKMVDNLLLAYKESIEQLTWMTDETRIQALDKLSKFKVKIGYPDRWRDYSAMSVKADDLIGNFNNLADVRYAEMLDKQKGKVRKWEWGMTPQTVNAYYNPTGNEIVFPAAILQPPFFDMQAEDAVNYGGIGAVIGHEIGHGFDDSGSTFDGDGVLRNWWTDADRSEFENRTAQLVEQYNSFEALPGLFVNGEYTLGENIGDLGGISIALKAYQMSLNGQPAPELDGFTGTQRVFIGFAQVWAAKYRDEAMRRRVNTDTHSPPKFRTNGPLRNVPEFYKAFGVSSENALYLAPENRVKIW